MIQPDLARSGAVSEPAWGSASVPEVLVMTVLLCGNLSDVRLQVMENNSRIGGRIQFIYLDHNQGLSERDREVAISHEMAWSGEGNRTFLTGLKGPESALIQLGRNRASPRRRSN